MSKKCKKCKKIFYTYIKKVGNCFFYRVTYFIGHISKLGKDFKLNVGALLIFVTQNSKKGQVKNFGTTFSQIKQ